MTNTENPVISNRHFIVLMACLVGLTAVGIDAVLPTFPALTEAFGIAPENHNDIQQVVFMYMLGFSLFPILFGMLADTLGRKPVLLFGICLASFASLSVVFVDDFEGLLWLRFVQGAGLAAPRVIAITIVRDRASGREMAEIMSFVMTVFLVIPALAPILGQLLLLVAPWQSIFIVVGVLGLCLLVWAGKVLPETLTPENTQALSIKQLFRATKTFLSHRNTLIYLYMISMMFAGLMTYIGQAEQILQRDVYHLGEWFPLAFAAIVIGQVGASMLNAKFVMRIGMRAFVRMALTVMVVTDGLFFLFTVTYDGAMPLWLFIVTLLVHFCCFSLMMPNLNTLALVPYHHMAGMASALIGTIISIVGLWVAQVFSHFYDGSLYSLASCLMFTTLSLTVIYQFALPEKRA